MTFRLRLDVRRCLVLSTATNYLNFTKTKTKFIVLMKLTELNWLLLNEDIKSNQQRKWSIMADDNKHDDNKVNSRTVLLR